MSSNTAKKYDPDSDPKSDGKVPPDEISAVVRDLIPPAVTAFEKVAKIVEITETMELKYSEVEMAVDLLRALVSNGILAEQDLRNAIANSGYAWKDEVLTAWTPEQTA